ncbi:MAG: DNA methyltransferase [bacterium]
MRTLRAAADLLAAADSIERLIPIAAAMKCDTEPSPLDTETRRSLGLDDDVVEASVAAGRGALRALLLIVSDRITLREMLPRLAARVSTRTPHVLWVVIATQPATCDIAIAAWTDDRRPPRIAALVANRTRLVDSDGETVRALAAVDAERDVLAHARWVEILGREALSVRFYRTIERVVSAIAASSSIGTLGTRMEIALLNTSRLLFLSFLEAKGWLDGDRGFLARQFDGCMTTGGRFHNRILRPLFFGTLNTPRRNRSPGAKLFGNIPFLNGGLFARTHVERRHRDLTFSDAAYGSLISDLFGQYRFTAREETASWSEAAIDPEMLGRAFESLMASPDRQRTGAFFTPFSLVERVTDAGLETALGDDGRDVLNGVAPNAHTRARLRTRLAELTILDPACGSGAFLVHGLERVAALRQQLGDGRDVSAIRRDVLTNSIFGVDVNPTAVWLCELRLWLSVVIESAESDPSAVVPLPNLDRNVRIGDALSGRAFGDHDARLRGGALLRRLRQRYATASGARKDAVGRQLDRAERERATLAVEYDLATVADRRRDLVGARRGRDLFGERYHPSRDEHLAAIVLRRRAASLRSLSRRITSGGALPFSFPVHFADVATRGGFGLIVGNPPWVRLHRIPIDQRAEFRREFEVARRAAWEPGAGPAGAGRGFAAQVDVAAVFVERSTRLLAPGAALALLLPAKLWRSLAGGGVRRWIGDQTRLCRVEDHSEAATTFDAAVYPSLVVAKRSDGDDCANKPSIAVAIHHRGHAPFSWQASPASLAFDASPGAPWILLPPDARRAFDRFRDAGPALARSPLGRPHLGVKCGYNDAFVVELLAAHDGIAEVRTADDRRVSIECDMLRPLLRGEALRRWRVPESAQRIIWTHDPTGAPSSSLPPLTARWLARWRRELVARTDARRGARWWSLFRTDAARYDRPRVVWGDVGREPRAAVLEAGDPWVPLNSCYIVRCRDAEDAFAFTALLNGPLARAWLDAIAEPARGGYHRYLGWTVSLLPTPGDWERARRILAPLGERAWHGQTPGESELFEASLDAYALDRRGMAPLVAWFAP